MTILYTSLVAYIAAASLLTVAPGTRPISRLLRKPAVVQACDRLTGGMFVAFGVGLALQSRRT
jgi:threonine/homoserine/homoserine lactone efflux protein